MLQKNQKKLSTQNTKKNKHDILSGEYTKLLKDKTGRISDRDNIIASILRKSIIQRELIKRLILEDNRDDVLMKLLGFRVSPHHAAFLSFFKILEERGQKAGMLLAPRGSGKSTCCDQIYAIRRSIQNPDINILIASRTIDQSKAFLSAVKGCIEKPQFIEVFGDLRGDVWAEKSISIKGRTPGSKEETIHIAGVDTGVVSKHFDIIICDDVVEEKNARTENMRASVYKFYSKSLLPTLRSGGEFRVLGTRYHPEDLYGHFRDNDKTFEDSVFEFPGVFDKDTGERVDLVELPDGSFELPENGTIWDPEHFPIEEVLKRRMTMTQGDFDAQYQNRIDRLRGDYFDAEWFQYYNEPPHDLIKRLDLSVWAGVDLAASEKEEADEFAYVVVGILPKIFEIYVLDYYAGRITFNTQKELLYDMFEKWEPVCTFIESNQYQAVLESTMHEEFPEIRTKPIWTTKDKITRAQAFQLYYERRQVFHRKNRSAKLEGQLTGFPHMKLKDLFDALYIGVWGALRGGRRSNRRKKEFGLFGG